jgi:hypothetical protein
VQSLKRKVESKWIEVQQVHSEVSKFTVIVPAGVILSSAWPSSAQDGS